MSPRERVSRWSVCRGLTPRLGKEKDDDRQKMNDQGGRGYSTQKERLSGREDHNVLGGARLCSKKKVVASVALNMTGIASGVLFGTTRMGGSFRCESNTIVPRSSKEGTARQSEKSLSLLAEL